MFKKNTDLFRMTVVLLLIAVVLSAIPLVAASDAVPQTENVEAAPVSGHATNILLSAGKDPTFYNIRWNSSSSAEEYVQWAKSADIKDGAFPADAFSAKAEKESGIVRAVIDSLEENTEYSYRVGSEAIGWSEAYGFKTGDFDDNEFSFLFISDAQLGVNGAAYDAGTWNTSLEKAREWFGDEIEFMLSGGDQVDDSDIPEQFDAFASPALLRSLPIMTTVGNHDNGKSYSDHFVQSDIDESSTSDAGKYSGDYWVHYDGVLIMNLNTNVYSRSTHKDFMEKAIAEYTELYGEPTWKIVVFHHSIYSAAVDRIEEGADRRERFADLMSEMDIDVVLMGHDHIYTRTYMMAGGLTPIDDASRYVKVGNDPYGSYYDPAEGEVFFLTVNTAASSKFYTMTDGKEPYAAYKNQESISNITKIDVTEDCIQFSTYRSMDNNDIGDVLDFFAIHKSKELGEDTHAPVLNVPSEVYNFNNSALEFLEGITAYDNRDGVLTDKISYSGIFSAPGDPAMPISTVTCSVTDAAGNTATKKINVTNATVQEVITTDSEWKYLNEGNYPFEFGGDQTEWLTESYDDSQWKTGVGAFGSIDDQLADHNGVTPNTLLPAYFPEGSDEEGSLIPNFFFRTTFDLDNPENIDILAGDLWYDDAALIYINGVLIKEIFQNSEFVTGYSTVDRDGPSTYGSFRITDPELIKSLNLKETGNVLAVELFQGHLESNDIFFNFESLIAASIIDSIEPPFSDVWVSHWYYEYVARAYAMGLFAGVTETTFEPKTAMTRAMVWTVLAKMSGIETAGGEKWYSNAQKWATENGVSDGSSPKNNISRQEIVTMLYSLSGRPEVTGNLDSYTDNASVSSWAFDALVWATEKGVMTGRGEGILDPRTALTRAEACTVILAYIDIE